MTRIAKFSLVALCAALSACSVLEGERIDYKSAAKVQTLEVPPDLTQLARDNRYTVPGAPVTASGFQAAANAPLLPTAATQVADVRIERAGNQRWLVVKRPPEQLWSPIRDFWQESGFLLTLDQANLGIMETDWAENRAKLPQDIIRATIGKLFDSLYSTGERDRFRTRLERTPDGGTEIYISHRGMIEVFNNERTQEQTIWQPRDPDPELEAEFLRRLMVKLGVQQEQATALIAASPAKPVARVAVINNTPVVQIDEGFDRAWRRVGLTLDRTGFTVEDRDRSQGLYFVRYVEPNPDRAEEPGFFSKLFSFGSSKDTVKAPLKFRIAVRATGDTSTVAVLNEAGQPERSENAQRIVGVIAADLR